MAVFAMIERQRSRTTTRDEATRMDISIPAFAGGSDLGDEADASGGVGVGIGGGVGVGVGGGSNPSESPSPAHKPVPSPSATTGERQFRRGEDWFRHMWAALGEAGSAVAAVEDGLDSARDFDYDADMVGRSPSLSTADEELPAAVATDVATAATATAAAAATGLAAADALGESIKQQPSSTIASSSDATSAKDEEEGLLGVFLSRPLSLTTVP